jgi:cell division protein FtsL
MTTNPLLLFRLHFFTVAVIISLYFGWLNRDSNYLSAETGTGYMLGIVGGSLMLTLLLYPVSKRVKTLTLWIPIQYWFGIHMLLGIIGPVLILYHSNFHLGSTNSAIALFSMLLVAGSGVVGRYIYTYIHHGLYGSQITLKELKQESENNHLDLLNMYAMDEELNDHLIEIEKKVLLPYTGLMTSLLHVISLAIHARRLKAKVMKLVNESYNKDDKEKTLPESKIVINSVNRYTLVLRKTAALKVYERMFSLWHVFHLPLFFMMIITAVIHIFAVHMY